MKKNDNNNLIYQFTIESSPKDFRDYPKPKELYISLKDVDIYPK